MVSNFIATSKLFWEPFNIKTSFFYSDFRQAETKATRSWYCKLFEGAVETISKGTADSKMKKVEVRDYSLSIGGFQQPEVFLMEHSDLKNRNDGFIGRLIVSCPFPTRHMWNEFQEGASAVKALPVFKQNFLSFLQVIHDLHKGKAVEYRFELHYFFHTFENSCQWYSISNLSNSSAHSLQSNIGFEGTCSLMRASVRISLN